jgi:fatty acid CoA ligase FadD32
VQITHLNLATNVVQVIEALEGEEADRGVSWLPFFHDMGLVTALLPSLIGHYFTFMTPAAFVRRPIRWMREIARQPGDTGGTISVAPNFAFDHAAARGLPKEGEEPLDLSNVKAVLNGSEPISAATVQRFNDAFGPFGFPRKAIKPSYGLAEATLFVSTTPSSEEPKIISVDRDELNANRFVPVPDDSPKAVAQAGAGKIGVGEWAVIVDHETASELPDGQIGEIWISGNNMGTGYWNKPEKTVETFQNTLKSRTTPSHADGAADDATWVRTGDLGAYHDDELYITGRTKDLVIIDGRNHYPQDLEYSAQEASKAVRTGFAAAFSVPANQLPDEVFADAHAGLKRDPKDTSEQLVVVAERAAGSHKMEISQVADAIRAAIAVRHGVTVRDVLLTSAGAIPRTSSGKIGRSACRSAYLDGSLRSGKVANAFPDETD